jgi:hypothetical protein
MVLTTNLGSAGLLNKNQNSTWLPNIKKGCEPDIKAKYKEWY